MSQNNQKSKNVHKPTDLEELEFEARQETMEIAERQVDFLEGMVEYSRAKNAHVTGQKSILDYMEPAKVQELKSQQRELESFFQQNLTGELLYKTLELNRKMHNPKKLVPYYNDTYRYKYKKGQLSTLRMSGVEPNIQFHPINKVAAIEKLRQGAYEKGLRQLHNLKNLINQTKWEMEFLNEEKDLIGENDLDGSLCQETKFNGTEFVKKEDEQK